MRGSDTAGRFVSNVPAVSASPPQFRSSRLAVAAAAAAVKLQSETVRV